MYFVFYAGADEAHTTIKTKISQDQLRAMVAGTAGLLEFRLVPGDKLVMIPFHRIIKIEEAPAG